MLHLLGFVDMIAVTTTMNTSLVTLHRCIVVFCLYDPEFLDRLHALHGYGNPHIEITEARED